MEVLCESSPITSADPPLLVDNHHQPSDSIDDQLSTLSLQPLTDNNGGNHDDGLNFEERVSVENENQGEKKREVEVENLYMNQSENEEEEEGENSMKIEFPVRPEADDCSFYLRTGSCKFGMNCRFNHPPDGKTQAAKLKGKEESVVDDAEEKLKEKDEFFGNDRQIDCKFYDRPGGCKFGNACRFNHIRKTSNAFQLNFLGLPIRLGEKECPYYMRNGSCKFGANCRFDHPDPASLGPDAISGHSNGGPILSSNTPKSAALAQWSPPALNGSPPYVPLIFPSTQGAPSRGELNAYQSTVYSLPVRSMNLPPVYAMNNQSLGRNVYTHQQMQILVDEFPERPGQPECNYFIKTGNCKYRSACKFHHPKNMMAKSPSCSLSDLGLPLRPGESICSFYNRYGICKYGPACKYDHPVNYAHPVPLAVSAVDQSPVLGNPMVNKMAMAASS